VVDFVAGLVVRHVHPRHLINVLIRIDFVLDFLDLVRKEVSQVLLILLHLCVTRIEACVLGMIAFALFSPIKDTSLDLGLLPIVKVGEVRGRWLIHIETLFSTNLYLIIFIKHLS
jgi:hypothetical protein